MRDRFSPLEFVLVIGVAFGYSIFGSIQDLLAGRTPWTGDGWYGSTLSTYYSVLYELLLVPGLVAVLYFGGWRLKDFSLRPTWAMTLLGVAIGVGTYAADWAITAYLKAAFPSLRHTLDLIDSYRPYEGPNIASIVALSLVIPAFEEIFVAGYVIEALRGRFGERVAMAVSVAIRTSYHLYQGIVLLPNHALYGIVQAWVYVKYGRLWPLIVSHAVIDAIYGMMMRI